VTEPIYRPAGPADAPALSRLNYEAYGGYVEWAPPGWEPPEYEEHEIAERFELPGTWGQVALHGDEPVGYVILSPARTLGEVRTPIQGLAHLWHLFVARPWWGSGVAVRLHAAAMDEARRAGYGEAMLRTPRDNARARRFYEREGWRTSGAELFTEELRLDLVEYRRMLRP
jgi:GNAT superfamily N-acetyltransferase